VTGTTCFSYIDQPVVSHDQHTHRLLTEIESGGRASQRSLSKDLGIALGLTNVLVRNLVHKGWVRVIRIEPNRARYLLTPAGIAEKARMSRQVLQNNVRFYAAARDRIAERFVQLSARWPLTSDAATGPGKRIVFYGAGEVAEIAYICLHKTDLRLVAVVDDDARAFFGVPVYSRDQLRSENVAGMPYGRLVVTSFGEIDEIRTTLEAVNIPDGRISWL